MQQGIFEKSITVTPDYCDAAAQLSPLAAFTIFQGIAAQHAELIGVGGAAMAKRGEFWLTVHTRGDFLHRAGLMDELTAATWQEPCDGRAVRCYTATACTAAARCSPSGARSGPSSARKRS